MSTNDKDDSFPETHIQGPSYPPPPPPPPPPPLPSPHRGTCHQRWRVGKLLARIDPNKAAGPDEIPCRSLNVGELPSTWLKAWITPVFEKGPRCEPENYLPVSLTCVMCKLMEHIICSHMRAHFDRHGILTELNHGFRARHSCESQLLLTTHDFLSRLDLRQEEDVLVLDYSKVFDMVPHERLLQKLPHYGIQGYVLLWIRSFLTTRIQSVVVDGSHSREDQVLSGVPQGTVLGPLLFLSHINDLPGIVDPHTAVRLFADDCLLYRSINHLRDQVHLQHDIHAISLWEQCWGMRFNVNKCHILHLSRPSHPDTPPVRFSELNNAIISEVESAKYIGALLSRDVGWSPHISVVHKAHQRLTWVRRNGLGAPYKYKAYQCLVRSQLEYCATVWDPTLKKDLNSLEQVQRKAVRWACGEYGVVSVTTLLEKLGWRELADWQRHQCLTLIYKTFHGLIAIPPDTISISRASRPAHGSRNHDNLQRPRASDKHSPLWHSFSFRTIPEWNNMPVSIAEADSLSTFRSRLEAHKT